MERRYHALAKQRTMVLRCESLEPPTSLEGQILTPRSAPACLLSPNADIAMLAGRAAPGGEQARPARGSGVVSTSMSSTQLCADPAAMLRLQRKVRFRHLRTCRRIGSGQQCARRRHCRYSRNGRYGTLDRVTASVRLDVEGPDDVAPLLGFLGDQLAELGRRSRQRRAAEVGEPRLHPRIGKVGIDLLV